MRVALAVLTTLMLLVHGYHPLAEDGGLYVAGVQRLLHPDLFPHFTAFVTAHLRYSIFAPAVAELVRATHLPLAWVLLLVYLFGLWLTLYAGLRVLRRCVAAPAAQLAGVALLAAWGTLPVAGTSLLLLDPYVTARSLSTPLSLLAIAFALEPWLSAKSDGALLASRTARAAASCIVCLLLAAFFHPLMAAYAGTLVLLLRLVRLPRPGLACTVFAAASVAVAGVLHALAPPESAAATAAVISRYYWFLSAWKGYELCGLAGPLAIFALLLRWRRERLSAAAKALCRACIVAGGTAVLIALLFAHQGSASHLVARLQPLRIFLPIYAVMALLLGATLTERWLDLRNNIPSKSLLLGAATVLALNACALFAAQRASFAASPHMELPWIKAARSNAWTRAFLWASDNTPSGALFALDADYITTPGEDAQTFRATALRSALPDFSKDGGEASITPSLAQLWQQGVAAQTRLSSLPDSQRHARLHPLGVTWMVLHSSAVTLHPCPYDNGTVKVCEVP